MTNFKRRSFMLMTGAAGLAASARLTLAADFPAKPITLVVPYPAGGGSDAMGRMVADAIAERLNISVVVENEGGAAGSIAGGMVARSAPDGYTIMAGGSAPIAANKVIQSGLTYDPQTDFSPISLVAESPLMLIGSKDAEASTAEELIALAKANPGKVSVGNTGVGSKGHIASALLAQAAGIEISYVPYRGSAPILADLLGGHIDYAIDSAGTYIPHVQEGKLKALGVTSARRMPTMPDLATIAEQGVEGYQTTLWYGCVGPAGIPDDIVAQLSNAIADWTQSDAGKEMLAQRNVTPIGGSPQDLADAMAQEIKAISSLVDAGVIEKQ